MPIDYEILRVIWWFLLGVLLIGFTVMDGFDLGVAIWLPWISKNDMEKRILINAIGSTWEGNQVWFILGGGAIFAAWPSLYALSFSGFYYAMLIVLLALILRPVGFKYRSKINHPVWRACWDTALFIGGFVPALIFGVAIGNVLQGVPFYFDDSLRPVYTGSFWALLNPFALLCGLLSVAMMAMHGAWYLNIRTSEGLRCRAVQAGRFSALLVILLFVAGGLWNYFAISGYELNSLMNHQGPSNPLHKTVIQTTGAWFKNFNDYPLLWAVPGAGLLGALLSIFLVRFPVVTFLSSAVSLAGIIGTVGVSMFPVILPSSTNPNHTLTVWDSSSSQLTLFIMLIATVIFLPVVLTYTAWVYRVLRGVINEKTIRENQDSAY